MSTNKKALAMAEMAHRKQTRTAQRFSVFTGSGVEISDEKTEPFILHPIRVALNIQRVVSAHPMSHTAFVGDNLERMLNAALLHDTIEDTKLTLEDLRVAGFCDGVVNDVARLTRDTEESYAGYIGRVSEGPLTAVIVKIADLLDNLDGYTFGGVFADVSLVKRYRKALAQLGWAGREAKQ